MRKISVFQFSNGIEYFGRIGRLERNEDYGVEFSDEVVSDNLKEAIDELNEFIRGFRAPATLTVMEDLKAALSSGETVFRRDIGELSFQIFDRFICELGDQWLIILDHENTIHLDDDGAPFGQKVREKFPHLRAEIDEAAQCLALSRYTASVFHLMRVMESSVHLLSRKMKAPIDTRAANWSNITDVMNKAILNMPAKTHRQKLRRQKFGEVIANLTAVRIAWRNEVMHPKKSYSSDEAKSIFNHVNGFMNTLIDVI